MWSAKYVAFASWHNASLTFVQTGVPAVSRLDHSESSNARNNDLPEGMVATRV